MLQTSLEAAVRDSIQSQCAKLLQLRQLYRSACTSVYDTRAREQQPKSKLIAPAVNDRTEPEAAVHRQAALADAILGAMSSLIDYYAMLCAIRIGVPESRITSVHHDWIQHPRLQLNGKNAGKADLLPALEEFSAAYKQRWKEDQQDRPDFWLGLYSASIEDRLKTLGVALDPEREEGLPGSPLKQLRTYFYYVQPLISNAINGEGLRFKLYSEINNVIKHNVNRPPRSTSETFDAETRWYTYIEIPQSSRPFLREGVLHRLLSMDFDQLGVWLSEREHSRPRACPIARQLGIDDRISLDAENGITSPDQATLYFFIDTVLVGKRRDGILIEAGKTLSSTAAMLCDTVLNGSAMECQPAHCCAS